MPRGIEIEHMFFDSVFEVNQYYATHPLVVALNTNWGVIRIEYPKGNYNGCYVFAVLSSDMHREIEIPRAVLLITNCTQAQQDSIETDLEVEIQPDTVQRVQYAVNVLFSTLKEVKEHFQNHPGIAGEMIGIFRIDCTEDEASDPRYRDCHVFAVFDLSVGLEMNVPRAVLPKSKCTAEDDYEIQQIEYAEYIADDDIEKVLSGSEELKPSEPESPPSMTPEKPGSGDKIN